MSSNTNKKRASAFQLVLKSAAWTLIVFALVAIGYFGAELLFGSM